MSEPPFKICGSCRHIWPDWRSFVFDPAVRLLGLQAGGQPLLFGTESCSGHCLRLEDLSSCDKPCANARDRRLAVLIADSKKGLPTGLADSTPAG